MAKVSRIGLLRALEGAKPGLSQKDIVQQATCFALRRGMVHTFNTEVACRCPTGLPDEFEGAIQAEKFMAVLSKLEEDDVNVELGKGELLIKGKARSAAVRMEGEFHLPVDKLEKPDKWIRLPEDFVEGIRFVEGCTGEDHSLFHFTCVYLTPHYVQGSNNVQVARYRMPLRVKESVLIRKDHIVNVVALEVTKFCEGENWIHFKNSAGFVISFRRHTYEYPNFGKHFKFTGTRLTLPRGVKGAAEFAGIFSEENKDKDQVLVSLEPGTMWIKGVGVSGRAMERKKVTYKGPNLSFYVPPRVLGEIVDRHNECQIDEEKLKVDGGRWSYFTILHTSNGAPDVAKTSDSRSKRPGKATAGRQDDKSGPRRVSGRDR